jgi:hypothetical protein
VTESAHVDSAIRGFEDLVQALFLRSEVYGTTHLYWRIATPDSPIPYSPPLEDRWR